MVIRRLERSVTTQQREVNYWSRLEDSTWILKTTNVNSKKTVSELTYFMRYVNCTRDGVIEVVLSHRLLVFET